MNTHQREWVLTVVLPDEKGIESVADFCASLVPKRSARWLRPAGNNLPAYGRIITRERYFITDINADDSAVASLEPTIVERGTSTFYEYPIYVDELQIADEMAFIIAAPYVALNREIWRNSSVLTNDPVFAAPALDKLFRHMLQRGPSDLEAALDSRKTLTLLRGGRINIAGDPNLRGVVLVGENVMQSKLYKHLSPVLGRRIVVHLDRFGNFRMRPGVGGTRLIFFKELLQYLDSIDAITTRSKLPADRILDLAGGANT